MQLTKEDIELIKKSYITKEELLEMITKLDFIAVKSLSLYAITGYHINVNRDGNDYLDTYCKEIRIDQGD